MTMPAPRGGNSQRYSLEMEENRERNALIMNSVDVAQCPQPLNSFGIQLWFFGLRHVEPVIQPGGVLAFESRNQIRIFLGEISQLLRIVCKIVQMNISLCGNRPPSEITVYSHGSQLFDELKPGSPDRDRKLIGQLCKTFGVFPGPLVSPDYTEQAPSPNPFRFLDAGQIQ